MPIDPFELKKSIIKQDTRTHESKIHHAKQEQQDKIGPTGKMGRHRVFKIKARISEKISQIVDKSLNFIRKKD